MNYFIKVLCWNYSHIHISMMIIVLSYEHKPIIFTTAADQQHFNLVVELFDLWHLNLHNANMCVYVTALLMWEPLDIKSGMNAKKVNDCLDHGVAGLNSLSGQRGLAESKNENFSASTLSSVYTCHYLRWCLPLFSNCAWHWKKCDCAVTNCEYRSLQIIF